MENQQPAGEAQNSQKEWYKKWWGFLIALAIWPLFAIWYIVEKKKDWSKEKQGFAIIGVIILAVIVYRGGGKSSEAPKEQPAQQAVVEQTKAVDNVAPATTQETKNDNNAQVPQQTDTTAQNNAANQAKASQEKADADKAAKEKAQKELDDVIALSKEAGLVKSYEFSDKASVVYVNKMWYTQEVSFKKDFLAKLATLKETITGYHNFEVRDAYSNEKVAEVTAFSGSLEVYK